MDKNNFMGAPKTMKSTKILVLKNCSIHDDIYIIGSYVAIHAAGYIYVHVHHVYIYIYTAASLLMPCFIVSGYLYALTNEY